MAEISDVVTALKAVVNNTIFPLSATVGGGVTPGDVLTIVATDLRGNTKTWSYTVKGGDTLTTIVAGLATAFVNAWPYLSDTSVTVNGYVLSFLINPGVWSLTGSVSGAASETLTFGRAASPIALSSVTLVAGAPTPADLDKLVSDAAAGTQRAIIAVAPRPHTYRNTSRYPKKWQSQGLTLPTTPLTVEISGTAVTLGGSAPGVTGTNFAVLVGWAGGGWPQPFVYGVQATDTLASIAAAMAALINVSTPATATGATISVPAAFSLVARIGITGFVIRELKRQCEIIDINIWTGDPLLTGARAQLGSPLREAIGVHDWIILADQSAGNVHGMGDFWLDDPEKAGLFRRLISYEVEYPTTEVKPVAQIVVMEVKVETVAGTPIATFNY